MDLREAQRPLKARYRESPAEARITLQARGSESASAVACSVDLGRAVYDAQAHAGVGGPGGAPCSGDLLLGALAACSQLTCQMVAESMGLEVQRVEAVVEGDLDLRGTLGIDGARVGFESIRLRLEVDAPGAKQEQLDSLRRKTERYCVVLQTLREAPVVELSWARPS